MIPAFWCMLCKHNPDSKSTCEAFPEGIPKVFMSGKLKHDQPHPGDHGLRYELDVGRGARRREQHQT